MFIFFMAAIPHSQTETFRNFLLKYLLDDAQYIIAKETAPVSHKETNGEHLHIAVEMEDKSYDNFRKTILVNHYKLRGKATKQLPRQYGKVREIRGFDKFMSYTCKDKNLLHNFKDLKKLQDYITQSYKKQDKETFIDEVIKYIDKNQTDLIKEYFPQFDWDNIETLEKLVLQYYQLHTKKVPAYSTIKHITLKYLMFHQKTHINVIYSYLRNK